VLGHWTTVIDVSWQPRFVSEALDAIGRRAEQWIYISSISAYADETVGGDENSPLHVATTKSIVSDDQYGPAKVACEALVHRHPNPAILRAGVLTGPGDPFDRGGYWVGRFRRAGLGSVLVPNDPLQACQALDIRDFVEFVAGLPQTRPSRAMDVVGETHSLGHYLRICADVAAFEGSLVRVPTDWLLAQGVPPAFGPGSLPVWAPGLNRFGNQVGERALLHGLVRRPLGETLTDMLRDEHDRGLARNRFSGMSRAQELRLIDAWRYTIELAQRGAPDD
jgi:nucleoside-diphosphate-sugar epimerase